ncbi:ribonuclease P protein subunit p25-like protein [Cloeon dipterum]|uniref:ribonuclease P protein subunit p25-like protein n=1 Tax=Cloeon dipterum TaxID=197152 RepID=UPI00321F711C
MMKHYSKGANREEVLAAHQIPIDNLPEDFLWMKLSPRSKVGTVLQSALKAFNDESQKCVVWSGSGAATEKAVACAEIMKKRWSARVRLHQRTKICFSKAEELWEPKLDGLDSLVVLREIPTIYILLSKEAIR